MVSAIYALLAAVMLCVGGTPVTSPPCTLPGPWDIRCLPGCFLQVESGTCTPCPHGSFMEHTNTDHTCRRCRSCDTGAGFEERRPCNAQADAECRCRPGLHCVSLDCPLCQGQPLCPPGQQPGPPPEATSCIPCPPGFYSDSTSTLPCKEHTRCEGREMSTFINGTRELDAICKQQNNTTVLIGSCFVVGVLVIVLTFLALFLYKRRDRCPGPITGSQAKGLLTMNTLVRNRDSPPTETHHPQPPNAEREQAGLTVYNISTNNFQMGDGNTIISNGGEAEPLRTDGPDGEDLDPPSGEGGGMGASVGVNMSV